ncbi:hypothetical protein SAMN05216359_102533 [Roseateles sp. YR242]|uniref:hypothetical protein n=1 Tax=Roseateles sp. YR242 TaxID=1855305 RepID=UPI0008D309D9|nr:hypothetical protein [Roseateles sp. YR242]SEK64715.1 hypothetical protein SAMN05216359_102533 [Roseateles sp. YR242]
MIPLPRGLARLGGVSTPASLAMAAPGTFASAGHIGLAPPSDHVRAAVNSSVPHGAPRDCLRAANPDVASAAPGQDPLKSASAMRHLAAGLLDRHGAATPTSSADIHATAAALPKALRALRPGLRFDAALRAAPLDLKRLLLLIEGPQDHALHRLPHAMQADRMDDLMRRMLIQVPPLAPEALRQAVVALGNIGLPRHKILVSAAKCLHAPGQVSTLLSSDRQLWTQFDATGRRELLASLAGRLALLAPARRAPMAMELWTLVTLHDGSAETSLQWREALNDRPGDGRLAASSETALTRFHSLSHDPVALPTPADMQHRRHAPGVSAALAHFGYWLHCQQHAPLERLHSLSDAASWRLIDHYTSDPLAASTTPRSEPHDALLLEQRVRQFNDALNLT